ncbi:MAG: DUF2157 domain-containing protein [Burkholderiales bacterium]|nr:DUF2157 domain-containing protein [Bacteroidia bacterium]
MVELNQIYKDRHIDEDQFIRIKGIEENKLFSIHWELRTILYLGILLLSSGIGILVYLNIDTIGHQAVLGAIAAGFTGCFYFANKHKLLYRNEKITHTSPFFDYVVLLGFLLFALFIGYFQYQYSPFGKHYGILVFIPTLLAFYLAYRFDHKGVLSIAITGLAGTFGLSVSPRQLIDNNDFSNLSVIFTALTLGIALSVWALYSDKKEIKKHFSFTYNNFAINILSIAALAALFDQDLKLISLLALAAICVYFIKYALIQKSYLFLLLAVLYGYIGLTYCIFYLLSQIDNISEGTALLGMLYVIGSAIGVIFLFLNLKKIVKQ